MFQLIEYAEFELAISGFNSHKGGKMQNFSRVSASKLAGVGKGRRACNYALEFEYLHRESRCEMLIGGGDISNDVITLGTWFSMSAYVRARFRFPLIGGNLTAQSTGSHRGIGGGIQILET